MSELIHTELGAHLARAKAFQAEAADRSPTWVNTLRRQAADAVDALRFPTTRDEDWRFTNIRPLAQTAFASAGEAVVTASDLDALRLSQFGGMRLVFVNGRFAPELSDDVSPAKATIGNLASLIDTHTELIEPHLTAHVPFKDDFFAALNTAFLDDGAFIHLKKGALVDSTIHLMFVTVAGETAVATHPRVLIVAEAGSQARIVETYHTLGEGVTFTNPVRELVAAQDAIIDYSTAQDESRDAFHVGGTHLELGRNTVVTANTMTLNGGIVRNNLTARLNGEHANASLHGMYLPGDGQLFDNHTLIEHADFDADSREVYKGILDGTGRAVFHGRILVQRKAQETDSLQTNNNLLLSDDARVNTKPQLEIYADQVKCSHGATIGQLDADSLFYLRSRGISASEARNLLIYAFAAEILDDVKVEPLQTQLKQALSDWLGRR